MRRRDFIILVGGAVSPLAARAQQAPQVRHIGLLIDGVENDAEMTARLQNALRGLGWSPGTNLKIDARFGVGDDSLHEKN